MRLLPLHNKCNIALKDVGFADILMIEYLTHLPMGRLFLTILWLPRVYSTSTVMGAEYVMSRKRHYQNIKIDL